MSFFVLEIYLNFSLPKTEAVALQKIFLDISQNLQENTCAKVSFLIKLEVSACNFIKKGDPGTGVFQWIFRNFQ